MKEKLPILICLILVAILFAVSAGLGESAKKDLDIQVVENGENEIEIEDFDIPLSAGAPSTSFPLTKVLIAGNIALAVCYASILICQRYGIGRLEEKLRLEINRIGR